MAYNNHHRLFLQNMMSKNVVSKEAALELYLKTKNLSGDDAEDGHGEGDIDVHKTVQRFVEDINGTIEKVNLKIKLMTCEATDKKVYVMHAINENEITKAAASRTTTKIEREFLRAVVKAVVTSPSGKISEIICLNLNTELSDHVSKKEVTKLLLKLAGEKWLVTIDGHVYLGSRTMAEMKKYLLEEYEDYIETCRLCKDITLLGEKCPSNCGIKMHKSCLQTYFGMGASRKCIGCKKPWPVATFNEDDSEEEAEH